MLFGSGRTNMILRRVASRLSADGGREGGKPVRGGKQDIWELLLTSASQQEVGKRCDKGHSTEERESVIWDKSRRWESFRASNKRVRSAAAYYPFCDIESVLKRKALFGITIWGWEWLRTRILSFGIPVIWTICIKSLHWENIEWTLRPKFSCRITSPNCRLCFCCERCVFGQRVRRLLGEVHQRISTWKKKR